MPIDLTIIRLFVTMGHSLSRALDIEAAWQRGDATAWAWVKYAKRIQEIRNAAVKR